MLVVYLDVVHIACYEWQSSILQSLSTTINMIFQASHV